MMRSGSRILAAVAAFSALAFVPPSQAAEELSIDHVESADGRVSVVVGVDALPEGAPVDSDAWEVSINGETVDVEAEVIESGTIDRATVLALDASRSMKGAPFEAAKEAAQAFLEAAPDDVQIGLVTFAGTVTTVVEPTSDRILVSDALADIELSLNTHLYDGVVGAVELAGSEGSRSVLVLSDGRDKGSTATVDDAGSAAANNGVVVDVVALDQAPRQRTLLTQIADASGGRVIDASSADALLQVFEEQADALAHQILLRFEQPAEAGADTNLEVSLVADGATFSDSALVSLRPVSGAGPQDVEPSTGGLGTSALLAGALALGVGLAIILGILFLGERGPSRAERQIADYLGAADPTLGSGGTSPRGSLPTQTSLRDSALALSERVVKGDIESKLNAHLVGGGISLTPAEWLLIHAGIAFASGFAGLILAGGGLMAVGLLVGAVLPWIYLRLKHTRRLAAFNAQLAETLTLIAGGLSAGLSMPQAIDTVVREGHEPMAGELKRTLIEQRLGVDITDALDGVADRMNSEDFRWVVMAIRIQREVGGNLAELLNTVSDTLREREYLRRQVRVLSAEGRFSGYVLGALPIFMFFYMVSFKGDYLEPLYTTGTGFVLIGIAVALWLMGFFVMSRLVKIEI